MQNQIIYRIGDATKPQADGNKIIAHICNNIGAFGKGFVLSVDRRWKAPKIMYKGWYAGARREDEKKFGLGETQFVKVENDIWVANMIAQKGIYTKNGVPPIRYSAVESCLNTVAEMAKRIAPSSIHMPRIGCGLAGGKWNRVEEIINRTLIANDIGVFVYDLR